MKSLFRFSTLVLTLWTAANVGAQTERIQNGGFENEKANWNFSGAIVLTTAPRSGVRHAYMGETANSTDTIWQEITIPSDAATADLSYWYNITSEDGSSIANDILTVTIQNTSGTVLTTIDTRSNLHREPFAGNPYYRQKTASLLLYKGQIIRVHFKVVMNGSLWTAFRIDDVSVLVTTTGIQAPTVETLPANPVGTTSATLNGRVVNNGGATITDRRIEWAKNSGNWGTGTQGVDWGLYTGSSVTGPDSGFSAVATGLQPGTTYKFRVYACNSPTNCSSASSVNILTFITSNSCSYSLSPSSVSVGAGTTNGSVSVTAGTGCAWTASSSATWLMITSGSSGPGSGTINYSVAANTGTSQRSATITVQGKTFTVTQSGTTATYTVTTSVSPSGSGTASGAGTYNSGQSVTVNATANTGYTFVNWTENGAQVSTSASYTFTLTANRNLTANFQSSGVSCSLGRAGMGVTIITHGCCVDNINWAAAMASAVNVRMGGDVSIYTLKLQRSGLNDVVIAPPPYNPTMNVSPGKVILVVDWSEANGGACGVNAVAAWKVADRIREYLQRSPSVFSLPFHLIGHSRGASVMSSLSNLLGTDGIWIDQFTTIDPYPYGCDPDVWLWENILFADNYFQQNPNSLATGKMIGDNSYFNFNLTGIVTENGYDCQFHSKGSLLNLLAHEQMHTWYHGTIANAPNCIDQVLIQWVNWYGNSHPQQTTGYYWSKIAGGNRFGADAAAGLHSRLRGLGFSNRLAVGPASPGWPNATVKPLATLSSYNVTVGTPVAFTYYYQNATTNLTIAFALDKDTNPFNDAGDSCYKVIGSVAQPKSSTINSATFTWTPTGADVGSRYIQVKASDPTGRVRYDYLLKTINVTAVSQPNSDLVIQNLSVTPTSLEAGASATVSFTVKNNGPGIAYASVANIRVNTSTGGVTTSDTPLVLGIETPSLDPNGTFFVSKTVAIPRVAGSGTYYVWVIIDVNNEANQGSNIQNDKAFTPLIITIPAAPSAIGDYAQVYATGTSGLRVRGPSACDAPLAGSNRFDNAQGKVIGGPQSCTFEGKTYTMWRIQWSDCVTGWSAQDWLKKIPFATIPCTENYTVSTSSSPSNGGTTSGGGTFASGTSVTVSASPASCYHFSNWTENGSVVSASLNYTFTVTGSRNLQANFIQTTYSIATISSPVAGGSTSGGGTKPCGSSVTVTASPNSGYNFVSWSENGGVVSTSSSYTFTANASRTLTANFAPITYTISASASLSEGGSVTGGGSYTSGSTATLTATPGACYNFVSWTENGVTVSTSSTYSFVVTSSRTLLANFVLKTFTVTTTASPLAGGTTSGGGTKNCGSSVTVTATPNTGYSFVNWTENENPVSTSANYTFTANNDRYLTANFAPTYSVNTSSSPSGGGTTTGSGTYNTGATATVTASANPCYQFANWTESGTVVSTSASYSFPVTGNRTLVANFNQPNYTITTSSSPSAGGSTSGGGSKECGSAVTVTATPNANYNFVNWTEGGNVVSTSASYSFTVNGNRSLVANFSQPQFTITTSGSPTAGGSTGGGGTKTIGTTATVVALANSCYTFVNWTEGGVVVSTSASYSFTVTGNRTLVANFNQQNYTVTTSSSPTVGGTTSGGGSKPCGSTATVVATPNSCYNFVNWTENGASVSTSASYSFTVVDNRSLVANFTPKTVTITTSASPTGGGTTSGGGIKDCGATVTLSAIPNTGYAFTNWTESGSVVSASASYSFTASANRTLVANFVAIPMIMSEPVVTNAVLRTEGVSVVVPGETNVFAVTAAVIGGGLINYQWQFGDGATSGWSIVNTAKHAYDEAECRPYAASVAVRSGTSVIVSNFVVAAACEVSVTNLQVKLNFSKPNADTCKLKAMLNECGNWAGKSVTLDVGGARVSFTLDAKGRGVSSNGTCRVTFKAKTGNCIFTAKLNRGQWREVWRDYGLVNDTIPKPGDVVPLPIILVIGDEAFTAEESLLYTATEGKTGKGKLVPKRCKNCEK